MNSISIFLFSILTASLFSYAAEARLPQPACSRFRVHLAKELPAIGTDESSFISRPLPSDLEAAIELWKDKIGFLKNDMAREQWLHCIRQFIFLDTNKNGIPDWTALVDGRPSHTLFSLDPDIDGDGIPNVLDPDPYSNADHGQDGMIPPHLKMQGAQGRWQEKLWLDQGVLAVNHTDEHVVDAMKVVYSVLQLKSIHNWKPEVRGLNVLYAFDYRSLDSEIAAYHPTAQAISLPGKSGFAADSLTSAQKCNLESSIIHELGHALLFGTLSAEEFKEKALQLGGWPRPKSVVNDIFSPLFFEPLPEHKGHFVTEYAETNVHEWFAESFAAYVWEKEALTASCGRPFKTERLSKSLRKWIESLLTRAQVIK